MLLNGEQGKNEQQPASKSSGFMEAIVRYLGYIKDFFTAIWVKVFGVSKKPTISDIEANQQKINLQKRKEELTEEKDKIGQEFQARHTEVAKVLQKHLLDNVVIHQSSDFTTTDGPRTNSAKTVIFNDQALKRELKVLSKEKKHLKMRTYTGDNNNDGPTKFVLKNQIGKLLQAVCGERWFMINLQFSH